MIDMRFVKGYMIEKPFVAASGWEWKNYYILGDSDFERHHEAYIHLRVNGHSYEFRVNREGELTVAYIIDGGYVRALVKKFGPVLEPDDVILEIDKFLQPLSA